MLVTGTLIVLPINAHADDWSSAAYPVLIASYIACFFALQLLVSLIIAIRRSIKANWKFGAAYLVKSLLAAIATLIILALVANMPWPALSVDLINITILVVVAITPPLSWLGFHHFFKLSAETQE